MVGPDFFLISASSSSPSRLPRDFLSSLMHLRARSAYTLEIPAMSRLFSRSQSPESFRSLILTTSHGESFVLKKKWNTTVQTCLMASGGEPKFAISVISAGLTFFSASLAASSAGSAALTAISASEAILVISLELTVNSFSVLSAIAAFSFASSVYLLTDSMMISTSAFFSAMSAFYTANSSDNTFVSAAADSSVAKPPSRRVTELSSIFLRSFRNLM